MDSMVFSSSPIEGQEHAYAYVDPSLVFGFISPLTSDADVIDLETQCVEIPYDSQSQLSTDGNDDEDDHDGTCIAYDDHVAEIAQADDSETSSIVPFSSPRTKKTVKNHHTGPISEGYIADKRKRQKAASKRTKTLVNLATRLHNMCGVDVQLKIKRETGKETCLSLPKPIVRRHVKTQAGPSFIKRQSSAPVEGTPKKRPIPQPQPETSQSKTISNLPGKKKQCQFSPNVARIKNKCMFCKIIFDSAADKVFRKKNGRKKAIWLGCDADECGEWTHAMCAQVEIPCLKRARAVPFYCPVHI